jgi:hypothetical protein
LSRHHWSAFKPELRRSFRLRRRIRRTFIWPRQAVHQRSVRAPQHKDLPFHRPRRTDSTSDRSAAKPLKPFVSLSRLLPPAHLAAPRATPRASSRLFDPKIEPSVIDSTRRSSHPLCRFSKLLPISEETFSSFSKQLQEFEQAPLKLDTTQCSEEQITMS